MMEMDSFSRKKKFIQIEDIKIAYYEEGQGTPLLFIHGCPFSSFIWRKIIQQLSDRYRCLAPDLLGLGDTETPAETDLSLRSQMIMILNFLDNLNIKYVHIVAHDHGGAVAQLIAAEYPDRIDRLVLSNVEAYNNWPSEEERPFGKATQLPVIGSLVIWLYSRMPVFRFTLVQAKAVKDSSVLTKELLKGYIRANLSDRRRRERTKKFLKVQFDPENNSTTINLLNKLKNFNHPTLLLWGADDVHFGVEWAERLLKDIPGAIRLDKISPAGHLVMEEAPDKYVEMLLHFLMEPLSEK